MLFSHSRMGKFIMCVCCMYECVFMVTRMHAHVCSFVQTSACHRSKGAKNLETNKLGPLCAATLYDVLHNTKWKIPPLAPPSPLRESMNREKNDTSNWATRVESVMSHWTEGMVVPVNLSRWPDASANTGSFCGVALPTPPSHNPVLLHPPCLSLNIFTYPDSENTVNSPFDSERAWEWGKCVMWYKLGATPGKLRSAAQANRHAKKNTACWWGQGCRGIGVRLES